MDDITIYEISRRLRELRNTKNKTQADMAEDLGISKERVRDYEAAGQGNGNSKVKRSVEGMKLDTFYQYLKCSDNWSANYLLGIRNENSRDIRFEAICDYTGLSSSALKAIMLLKKLSVQKKGEEKPDYSAALNYVLSQHVFLSFLYKLAELQKENDRASIAPLSPKESKELQKTEKRLRELGWYIGGCEIPVKAAIQEFSTHLGAFVENYVFPHQQKEWTHVAEPIQYEDYKEDQKGDEQ